MDPHRRPTTSAGRHRRRPRRHRLRPARLSLGPLLPLRETQLHLPLRPVPPPRPYIQWTRRIDGKTIRTNLTEEKLAAYQPVSDNAHRLGQLIDQLETLTLQAIWTVRLADP